MTAGVAPKLFGAVEKGIAQLRQTRALKGAFIKRKDLVDTLNSRFGEAEVKATLGDFFKAHPDPKESILISDLEKAIKPVPEVGVEVATLGKSTEHLALLKEKDELIRAIDSSFDESSAILDELGTSVGDITRAPLLAKLDDVFSRREVLTARKKELFKEILETEGTFPKFTQLGREFPEGADYTERLYKIPDIDFVDPHFETKGVFANTRTSDLDVPESLGGAGSIRRSQLETHIVGNEKLAAVETDPISKKVLLEGAERARQELASLPPNTLRMIEEMQAKAIAEGVELPAFKKSWSMYLFKNELAEAAADPNIKYIGWSSGETVRSAEGAAVGSGAHTFFAKLYDIHLPKNVKNYTSRWGVEPKEVNMTQAPGKTFTEIEKSRELAQYRVVQEEDKTWTLLYDGGLLGGPAGWGDFRSNQAAMAHRTNLFLNETMAKLEEKPKTAWVLPITDQMRTDILTKGQPIDLKAITVASGAGAMGAVTTQDVQAEQEQKGLGRRVMDAWMGQDPILSLYKNPWIRKGVGMAFGAALSGQAILFAALKADEETRELVKEGKMSIKDRDIYARKASRDAAYASVFKSGWKTAVLDYYETVTGESPFEMFKDFKLPIGFLLPPELFMGGADIGIDPHEEIIVPGVIPSTAVFMLMDATSDPLLPVNILAPVSLAIKLGKAGTVAVRTSKIIKALDDVPGLTQKYGMEYIKAFAEVIAKAPATVRKKFADKLMANKNNAEAFMIGLLDNKQPNAFAPVARQAGRPVSDMTIDEYRNTMSNPQRGNRETSRFIFKETGVTEKEYLDPKTRVAAQKKIVQWYKTAFGISDEVDVLSVPKNTVAVAKTDAPGYRINIALDAKPIHIAEEMTHVKDMTRGYFGTPDISQGHFMDLSGESFAADFVHMRSVKNTINNGDAVRNEVLTHYILQRKDWARAKANLEPLPSQPIPPGLRALAKDDKALLEFISSTGDSVPPWVRVSDAERIAAGTKLADDPATMASIWEKMGNEGVLTDEVVAANIDLVRQFIRVTQNPGNEFLRRTFIDNYANFSKASSETASTHRWMQIALRRQDVLRDEIRIGLGGAEGERLLKIADEASDEALGAFFKDHPNIFKESPGLGDAITEYYVNSLLTSLSAHTTNFISNLLFGTYNVFIKHPATALVDTTLHKLTGREQQVYLGEVLKAWASVPRGARKGARAAGLVIKEGGAAGIERLGIKYEVRRSWIDTKNVPELVKFAYNGALRFMMAGDVFFRAAVGGAHLEALAYRAAKRSGGAKTFEDIIKNPPQWMFDDAEKIGARTVYFDDPGGFMGKVLEGRNIIPARLGIIAVPFVHTLTRIVARGVEMTPVIGAVRALPRKVTVPLRIGDRYKLHKRQVEVFKRLTKLKDAEVKARELPTRTAKQSLRKQEKMVKIADERKLLLEENIRIGQGQKRVLPEAIVDQITGLLIAVPAYSLYSRGKITGNYPADPKEKKKWKIQGKTPFSIQTGRGWRRYNDVLGPFGYPLAAWVSVFETMERRGDEPLTGEEEERILESFMLTARDVQGYMMNNTFLRNAMEGVDALTGFADEPVKYAIAQSERWLGNTLSGFAPYAGLMRQFNRARTAYDVGQTVIRRPEGVLENFAASLGFAAGDIKVDYRGRPAGSIERITEEGGKVEAFAVQMFPFLRARFPKADEVDTAFLMSGYLPGLPNRNINKIRLNDEFYHELQILRGRAISEGIKNKEGKVIKPGVDELVKRPSWKSHEKVYRNKTSSEKSKQRAMARMRNLLEIRVTTLTTKVRTRFKRRPDVRLYLEANKSE